MKYTLLMLFNLLFWSTPKAPEGEMHESIYEYQVKALDGSIIDFADFKGKKILIVNTASKCGYTPQYEGLEALYKKYQDKLVIVGFPSNNFGFQEPGSDEDIASFCKKNYGVTFPMASKVDVKGKKMTPIYHWLTKEEYNHYENSSVKWNFQKYLLNEEGQLIGVYSSKVKPQSEELITAIEQ